MSRDELYLKYQNLIFKVIKDLNCRYKDDEELQEYIFYGKLGLINAIDNYKEMGNEGSGYFYTCIKNSILRDFKEKLTNKRKLNYLYKDSLDNEVFENTNYYEFIPDENVHIEEDIIENEKYEYLYKAIDKLRPHYKEILCDYYGIKRKRKTLDKIAAEHGITRQAIMVKKDNALRDLRKIINKMGSDIFEL